MSEKNIKLVIAEKPSVAQSIAKVIGADKREDGYLEGNGYIVSWCVGIWWSLHHQTDIQRIEKRLKALFVTKLFKHIKK